MTVPNDGLFPLRELVRVVEGVDGHVGVGWSLDLRFGFGRSSMRHRYERDIAIVDAGADALAVLAWDASAITLDGPTIGGQFETSPGSKATIVLSATQSFWGGLPLPLTGGGAGRGDDEGIRSSARCGCVYVHGLST